MYIYVYTYMYIHLRKCTINGGTNQGREHSSLHFLLILSKPSEYVLFYMRITPFLKYLIYRYYLWKCQMRWAITYSIVVLILEGCTNNVKKGLDGWAFKSEKFAIKVERPIICMISIKTMASQQENGIAKRIWCSIIFFLIRSTKARISAVLIFF